VCEINDPGHTCDEYLVLLTKLGMALSWSSPAVEIGDGVDALAQR
jgi:hypothetical protein